MTRLATIGWVAGVIVAVLAGCAANPPDRRADLDRLTQQIQAMAGVRAAHLEMADRRAQGLVYFTISADVADDISPDQLAAIVAGYLHSLKVIDYRGYRAEFDARHGWDEFAVDSGELPITNGDQIAAQARDWVALRDQFRGATVTMRATVTHPGDRLPIQEWGHSNIARIDLPDPADYATVTATVTTLTDRFAELGGLNWTMSAGKQHPADIKSSRRFPTSQELDVWNRVNADQSIAHIDRLTINGPVTPPAWLSEKTTQSRDPGVALQLARRHLPVVATLPPPVLYTASDQISGHIGAYGRAKGPVAITVGGCTPRDVLSYRPTAAEQALINAYENCRS
jgi:hypothetical protein